MRIPSKILSLATILVIHQTHSMMPRAHLTLKELQKASCLKMQSSPIRIFTRSNHTAAKPVISPAKSTKRAFPFFLAAIGTTILETDSKPDNQFLQNANALVQDIPFYKDFLEASITTSMATQSIERLYEFVKNQSKKLPKAEQERMFDLFITQWCQDKLQPILERGLPFSEIEKTVLQPLKDVLQESCPSARYQQIETLTDTLITMDKKNDTNATYFLPFLLPTLNNQEMISVSLKILDAEKPVVWHRFFNDLEKLSGENNPLVNEAHSTLVAYLEKTAEKIYLPKTRFYSMTTLSSLTELPIQTKEYILAHGSSKLLASLFVLNQNLFTLTDISALLNQHPQSILDAVNATGFFTQRNGNIQDAISDMILQKSSCEDFKVLFQYNVMQLSEANKTKWIERFERENYNALTQAPPSTGPLFSNHLEKHNKAGFLIKSMGNENFYNLLPAIVDYVEQQYSKKRIVLFHGQSSDWIFLEKLYHRLYEQKQGAKTASDYRFLRFTDHSSLSKKDVGQLQQQGVSYHYQDPLHRKENTILFTNLHPFINDAGGNSWLFALDNRDFSGTDRIDQMLPTIFKNLNLTKACERLQKEYPLALTELKELFDAAIKEQGRYGQLLVISLEEKLAKKLTYSTDPDGRPEHHLSNQKLTKSTVDLAKNPNEAPSNHQHALILSEEIINPKAAQKAGVQIVSFDPVAYWRTEKYCAFEKKLDEVVELIEKLETNP